MPKTAILLRVMRDRELVERVKDATDLLALVGQAVNLRKQGGAWVGRCPFHSERTPSFHVIPEKGFYHCFGCGKHGDAFTWLQERDGLSFPEALEQLAGSAGIELPRQRERSSAEMDLESKMRGALDAAQAFYQTQLLESAKAKAYLRDRGFEGGFLAEAGFGYSGSEWEGLLNHLKRAGFGAEVVEQAGLASRSERGSLRDFLYDRLTIPIHDARGRLVAFGGRAWGDIKPKYLNTRETALFNKGSVLFGFHRAKGHLKDGALVVEGYFDVLQLHQQGIHAAMAPLGTALTESHLQMISRFTKRLVLCFDGDEAGLRAMEKGLRLSLPLGFDVRLLLLPQGEDPDTWCLKLGAEAFRELLRNAPDWTSFVVNKALEGRDFRKIPDRMEALRELAGFLGFLPTGPERRELFASLAHQLQLPLVELERAVQSRRGQRSVEDPVPVPALPSLSIDDLLRPLLVLAREVELRRRIAELPPAWWEGLEGAPLLQALLDAEGDDALVPDPVLARVRQLEANWAVKDGAELMPERVFLRLEQAFVMRELQATGRQLLDPQALSDPILQGRLEQRQAELLRRKAELGRVLRSVRS